MAKPIHEDDYRAMSARGFAGTHMGICAGMRVDVYSLAIGNGIDMPIDVRDGMRIDTCSGIRADRYTRMCVDRCISMPMHLHWYGALQGKRRSSPPS